MATGLGYSTSKMAVARAACWRAVEWIKDGIRLNVIAPGNSLTPLTQAALDDPEIGPLMRGLPVPFGRWAENEEIADVALWLLGHGSRYLVGSWIAVDGGTGTPWPGPTAFDRSRGGREMQGENDRRRESVQRVEVYMEFLVRFEIKVPPELGGEELDTIMAEEKSDAATSCGRRAGCSGYIGGSRVDGRRSPFTTFPMPPSCTRRCPPCPCSRT